jgi:hypothetical protein
MGPGPNGDVRISSGGGVIIGGATTPPGTPPTTPPGTPPATCALTGMAIASAATNENECLIIM